GPRRRRGSQPNGYWWGHPGHRNAHRAAAECAARDGRPEQILHVAHFVVIAAVQHASQIHRDRVLTIPVVHDDIGATALVNVRSDEHRRGLSRPARTKDRIAAVDDRTGPRSLTQSVAADDVIVRGGEPAA